MEGEKERVGGMDRHTERERERERERDRWGEYSLQVARLGKEDI